MEVLCDVAGISRTFTYRAPASWSAPGGGSEGPPTGLLVGTRVRVDLAGRRVGGWVLGEDSAPPAGVPLAPVRAVVGPGPPAAVVDLARWAAWRWAGPLAGFLGTASPRRSVRELPPRVPRAAPGGPPEDPALAPLVVGLQGPRGERDGRPILVRLGPAEDPFPLVLAALRRTLEQPAPSGPPNPGTVVVLVPNTAWAARLARRLEAAGFPSARYPEEWDRAAAGWPVVVGSRAAVWAPCPALAAVVVLDAHDEAYQEERSPTWRAWEVAAERARREGAPCLWVSACPTLEQLAAAGPPRVPGRARERAGWPALVVVDRRRADPRSGLYGEALVATCRRALASGGGDPVVLVLNRTGRARLLACVACGELARCEHCGRPLAGEGDQLACPGCRARRPVVCASCGATRLANVRPGVSRVREELEALLGIPVAEVTAASAPRGKGRGAGEDPGAPGGPLVEAPVLVGTEAVLHRVRRAAAVGFLDFDHHVLAPRMGAGEEALALLARAGRLVGGRARPVVVQTRVPDHEVLAAALHGDPAILARAEEPVRRAAGLPPFGALALLSGAGAGPYGAALAASHPAGVEVAEIGEGRVLVSAPERTALCDALAATPRPRGRLRVEVDPRGI